VSLAHLAELCSHNVAIEGIITLPLITASHLRLEDVQFSFA